MRQEWREEEGRVGGSGGLQEQMMGMIREGRGEGRREVEGRREGEGERV